MNIDEAFTQRNNREVPERGIGGIKRVKARHVTAIKWKVLKTLQARALQLSVSHLDHKRRDRITSIQFLLPSGIFYSQSGAKFMLKFGNFENKKGVQIFT